MCLRWSLGMDVKQDRLLRLPAQKIVLGVNDVKLLAQQISSVSGFISEMKQLEVWAWLTKKFVILGRSVNFVRAVNRLSF